MTLFSSSTISSSAASSSSSFLNLGVKEKTEFSTQKSSQMPTMTKANTGQSQELEIQFRYPVLELSPASPPTSPQVYFSRDSEWNRHSAVRIWTSVPNAYLEAFPCPESSFLMNVNLECMLINSKSILNRPADRPP